MKENPKISFLGAGNASFRLALAFKAAGCEVPYIWNRSKERADELVKILNKPEYNLHSLPNTRFTQSLEEVSNSDILIIALSDSVVEGYANNVSAIENIKEGKCVVCHISGSLSSNILNSIPKNGVFYPLMTLSKIKPVDMTLVPFLLEASDDSTFNLLTRLTTILGSEYNKCNSEERLKMHLAGVFISNFVNYLIGLSYNIAKPNHTLLLPLAIETVRKAFLTGHPFNVQTGPAIREDYNTIKMHKILLDQLFPENDDNHKIIYDIITNSIVMSKKKFKK